MDGTQEFYHFEKKLGRNHYAMLPTAGDLLIAIAYAVYMSQTRDKRSFRPTISEVTANWHEKTENYWTMVQLADVPQPGFDHTGPHPTT